MSCSWWVGKSLDIWKEQQRRCSYLGVTVAGARHVCCALCRLRAPARVNVKYARCSETGDWGRSRGIMLVWVTKPRWAGPDSEAGVRWLSGVGRVINTEQREDWETCRSVISTHFIGSLFSVWLGSFFYLRKCSMFYVLRFFIMIKY